MAGLACGEPNTISWDILKNHVTTFVSADDPITVRGMRMLAAPLKGDAPIVSGESGAVPSVPWQPSCCPMNVRNFVTN